MAPFAKTEFNGMDRFWILLFMTKSDMIARFFIERRINNAYVQNFLNKFSINASVFIELSVEGFSVSLQLLLLIYPLF